MVGDQCSVRSGGSRGVALVYHDNERVGQWLLDQIPYVESWSPGHQTIGLERGGKLIAGVVFEHFTGHDIDVSVAVVGGWVSHTFARAVFRYVFHQLTCRRISCEIAGQNAAMRHIAGRLGFMVEGEKRDAIPGDSLVMMGMLRSECRYIK